MFPLAACRCGQFVLFDVPAAAGGVSLRSLNVTGYLMFADEDALGPLHLSAQYIIVMGVLSIGTPTQHFRCDDPPVCSAVLGVYRFTFTRKIYWESDAAFQV